MPNNKHLTLDDRITIESMLTSRTCAMLLAKISKRKSVPSLRNRLMFVTDAKNVILVVLKKGFILHLKPTKNIGTFFPNHAQESLFPKLKFNILMRL